MAASTTLRDTLERPADRPPIITITGDAGIGKTTLAALFPNPVFIRTEDGVESIPADHRPFSFPVAKTFDDVLSQLRLVYKHKREFATVVIDSVTRLASIIESELVKSDPRKPKSINQAFGGYGAGLQAAAERHRVIQRACVQLNEIGLAVVFVAHSMVETVEPPDSDPYIRATLRLDKRAAACYIDDVDAVAFVKLKTRIITKENAKRSRMRSDGTRVIVLTPTGAHVAKNRYGIEDPIEWGDSTVNPLLPLIPFYAKQGQLKRRRDTV